MEVAPQTADTAGSTAIRLRWAALAALLTSALLLLRPRRPPRRAEIRNLANDTSVDLDTGAVRSVQTADLVAEEPGAVAAIWTPMHLERLARTYWRFLERVTLGMIRVGYSQEGRSIVLLAPFLRLLTFKAPEYEIDPGHGIVRWSIDRGLLVSRRGRDGGGYLQIEVTRDPNEQQAPERMHVEVSVVNFYPSIASRLSLRIYNATQSRLHVIITYAFLRSLARLDLAESRVGQFAGEG